MTRLEIGGIARERIGTPQTARDFDLIDFALGDKSANIVFLDEQNTEETIFPILHIRSHEDILNKNEGVEQGGEFSLAHQAKSRSANRNRSGVETRGGGGKRDSMA